MQAIRHGVYRADGVRLAGLEAGPADGPLVILLHGFPEDAQSWAAQVEALAAAGMRVLAPDQRGYRASDKPQGLAPYRIDQLADDVAALASGLGYERFALAGHDWGGAVAWWTATRRPERVTRLAVLNAPHPRAMAAYARTRPSQYLRSAYMAAFQPPWIAEAVLSAGDFATLAGVLRASSRPGAFDAAELERLRQGWRTPGALTAMLNWYRALRLKPERAPSRRVTAPTLIVWGAKDAFLEVGLADASAALCDSVQRLVLPHATHWMQREEPEAVNAALVGFFARGEGGPVIPDAA